MLHNISIIVSVKRGLLSCKHDIVYVEGLLKNVHMHVCIQ